MRFFSKKFSTSIFTTSRRSSTTSQGQQQIERLKIYLEQKEYKKALDLASEIGRRYPEFFKALFIYEGEAGVGLAKQRGLLPEESISVLNPPRK